MLPTPDTSHISFDNIYEPAEDSYLLLDTLSSPSETSWLQHRFQNFERHPGDSRQSASPLVLEVGVGSGVVLAFAAANAEHIFGRRDVLTLATDVNAFACRGATTTVSNACATHESGSAMFGDVLHADFVSPLRPGIVDVLICNPPYVPTEALPDRHRQNHPNGMETSAHTFERDSHLLALSYAGGIDGMEMTDVLLSQLPAILHPTRGVAYVLLCAQNKPLAVRDRMRDMLGFSAELVGSSGKQAGWEKLQILRIWKSING